MPAWLVAIVVASGSVGALWDEEGRLLRELVRVLPRMESAEAYVRLGAWERATGEQLANRGEEADSARHLDAADEALREAMEVAESGALPEVLYALGDLRRGRGRADAAREPLARVVEGFASHPLAIDAANALGDDAFDAGRLAEAVARYEFVRAQADEGAESHGYATYKLAWCRINLDAYEEARALLLRLVNGDGPLAKQARRDLVIALARDASTPAPDALARMRVSLPQALFRRSVASYASLVAAAGRDEEAASILTAVEPGADGAELARILALELEIAARRRDVKTLVHASVLLADVAEWAGSKVVGESGEAALRTAAARLHGEARAAGDRAGLDLARVLYDAYFRAFEAADGAYELHHHAGELHRFLGDARTAEHHFTAAVVRDLDRLEKHESAGKWLESSARGAVESAQSLAGEPPSPARETRDEEVDGPEEEPSALTSDETLFVAACDRYLAALPASLEAPSVAYRRAAVLFRRGRHAEASIELSRLATDPKTPSALALDAMRLSLESLRRTRRYEEVALLAKRYAGWFAASSESGRELSSIEERAWLAEAARAAGRGEAEVAVHRYVTFARTHEDSPRAATALYNAAVARAQARRPLEAAALLRELLERPSDLTSRAREALYEALVTVAKFDEAMPVALSLARASDAKVAAKWLDRAITCAEASGDRSRAEALRRRFLENHPRAPEADDHARSLATRASGCAARVKAHRAWASRSKSGAAARVRLAEVEASCGLWEQAVAHAREVLQSAAKQGDSESAADAKLVLAEESAHRAKAVRIVAPFASTLRRRVALVQSTEASLAAVIRYGRARPAACALVKSGEVQADLADELMHATPPRSFDEEQRAEFAEQLAERAQPMLDRAIEAFEAALLKASGAGVQPPCLERATRRLALLVPAKYGPRAEAPIVLARPSQALAIDVAQLLDAAPDASPALVSAAHAELALGRPASALLLAMRIDAADAHAIGARELLAASEAALGLGESAYARWFALAAEHPERDVAVRHLADAALAIRHHEGAVKWLETLLERSPEDVDVLVDLAFAQRSLGAPDEARAALERALSIRPDHPPALLALSSLLCAEGARPAEGLRLADLFDASGSVPPDPARWQAVREACRALAKEAP